MQPATTFPVCAFRRVFDTVPVQEVLTLAELTACMRRFQIKDELHVRIQRELARIDHALEQVLAGTVLGERASTLAAAGREAERRGADPVQAMRAKAEALRTDRRREAKRDLRLWSPALYREGWPERGSDGVTHISCLVMDHDRPMRIQDAIAPFSDHFLLWHSTWSYTHEHPKFRVILPLAAPVPAAQWDALWTWAYKESGGEIDRAMSGPGTTYALPATPGIDAPRDAGSLAGPLLDPLRLGIDVGPPVRLPVRHRSPSWMLGDPEKTYVVHGAEEAVHVYDDPEDDDEAWEGRATWMPDPALLAKPEPTPDRAPLEPREVPRDSRDKSVAAKPPKTSPSLPPSPKKARGRSRKKTLVLDFDGVLHSYRSGWQGATVISDPPVPGALEWLEQAVARFEIAILSSRSREKGGIEAMKGWLSACGLPDAVLSEILFPKSKPPAHVYIDDRGYRFEGTFPGLDELDAFEPWHRR